jgi:predicted enzyme related to lactoylglutathione lyase
MPTIVHFEIPTDNVEKSKRFYTELFGWSIKKLPPEKTPEGIEYWTITTTDDKGNNAIAGGLMKRIMPEQQGITNYIDVESVDEYSAKVEQLGGKVRMSKSPVPNMGYFAVCSDTENNTSALWETDNSAK